jgi:hypothetical protein
MLKIVVLAERLDVFRLGAVATVGSEEVPIRQFVLSEKRLGWIDIGGLNPESLNR